MGEGNLAVYTGHEVHPATLTLRDFVAILFRQKRLTSAVFLGILLASILFAVLEPSRYQAQMEILVKQPRVDPLVTSNADVAPQAVTEVSAEQINSEVELLKSRDLLRKVVLACALVPPQSAKRTGKDDRREDARIARAVRALEKDLKVEVVTKTDLIAVSYESSDPQLAARVLRTLTGLYLEKHLAVQRPPGMLEFFEQQAAEARKALAQAEARLVDFTKGGRVVSAQLEKDATLQKVAEFDGTLKQTQAAIADTRQRIGILEQQSVSTPPRMVTQVRNTDDALLLSQLRANLLALELKRTELLGKFAPTYRPVLEVEAQLAETRTALAAAEKAPLHEETTDGDPTYGWVKEELAKEKANLAGLEASASATALTVESYREKARQLEQKEVVQEDLISSVKAKEENYDFYLRKEEEARVSDAMDRRRMVNVVVAEAASVPSLPSNHRGVIMLVGLLLATLASLVSAFGSEYLVSTFRTPDEVMLFLNMPVLAAMPLEEKNELQDMNREDVLPYVP
jgi:uncharacterized protein involved in exopolysaccharide biosynthesis